MWAKLEFVSASVVAVSAATMPMARASVVVAALFAAAEMRTVVSVATAIASIVGLVQARMPPDLGHMPP